MVQSRAPLCVTWRQSGRQITNLHVSPSEANRDSVSADAIAARQFGIERHSLPVIGLDFHDKLRKPMVRRPNSEAVRLTKVQAAHIAAIKLERHGHRLAVRREPRRSPDSSNARRRGIRKGCGRAVRRRLNRKHRAMTFSRDLVRLLAQLQRRRPPQWQTTRRQRATLYDKVSAIYGQRRGGDERGLEARKESHAMGDLLQPSERHVSRHVGTV